MIYLFKHLTINKSNEFYDFDSDNYHDDDNNRTKECIYFTALTMDHYGTRKLKFAIYSTMKE